MSKYEPVDMSTVKNEGGTAVSKSEWDQIEAQQAEISGAGVLVTGIEIRDDGGPPRFSIQFQPGEPSARVRLRLEEKHYDVGQNLSGKNLSFYVVKRVEQTKGWDV